MLILRYNFDCIAFGSLIIGNRGTFICIIQSKLHLRSYLGSEGYPSDLRSGHVWPSDSTISTIWEPETPQTLRFPLFWSPRSVSCYDFQYFGARGAPGRASLFARRELLSSLGESVRDPYFPCFLFTVFGAQIEGALILDADLTV